MQILGMFSMSVLRLQKQTLTQIFLWDNSI